MTTISLEPPESPESSGSPAAPPASRSRSVRRAVAVNAAVGVAFGFVVSSIGFTDYGELHRMFTFQDLRMFLAFAIAVALAAVLWLLSGPRAPQRRRHAGLVPGGVLFGIGWVLAGACPAIPLMQLGSGRLPAVVSLGGVLIGMRLCRSANARWFHLDRGSCGL